MKHATKTLLSLVVAGFCYQACAEIVYFGDSLTDGGYFRPKLHPSMGQFTTNPDNTWASHLSNQFGEVSVARTLAGQTGNNYAIGGARAGVVAQSQLGAAQPVSAQIDNYLATSAIKPDSIYSIWVGANDLLAATQDRANAQNIITESVSSVAQSVDKLHKNGAKTIVLPNIPDIGLTPMANSLNALDPTASQTATNTTSLYNKMVLNQVKATGANVVVLDTFGLLQQIAKDPKHYGFDNMTTPACGATSSLTCLPNNWIAPNANMTHFFADGIHPTGKAHKMIGDYAYAVITAPAQIAQISQMAHTNLQINERQLDNKSTKAQGRHVWLSAYNQSSDVVGDSESKSVMAGVDFVGDTSTTSVYASQTDSEYKNSVRTGVTDIDLKTQGLGLSHYQTLGAVDLRTKVGFGGMDIKTTRQITLDTTQKIHAAQADGRYIQAGLDVLYPMQMASGVAVKPYVGVTVNRTVIDGLDESEYSSTAMSFDAQKYTDLIGKVGVQSDFVVNDRLSLGGSLAYHKSLDDTAHAQSARLKTVNHSFDTPVSINNSGVLVAGVNANYKLGDKLTALAFISHQNSDNDNTSVGVGLSASF